jgi:hypothetical protein
MTRRARPEQTLHKAVVDHLRWRAGPGVWWAHIPNGGARSPIEALSFARLASSPSSGDTSLRRSIAISRSAMMSVISRLRTSGPVLRIYTWSIAGNRTSSNSRLQAAG